jgi:hypothetical protein
MTSENKLAPIQDTLEDSITPAVFNQRINAASQKAKILKNIVDQQQLSVKIGKGEHLRVEGWQTIAAGYGYTCATTIEEFIKDGDRIIGVKAHCVVYDRMGQVCGGADAVRFGDEDGAKDQNVSQWAGMAQTRAVSRALRELLAWVAILAGFSATPAEEMTGVLSTNPTMLCPLHDEEWFQRGKMQQPAHPIEGKKGPKGGTVWCNQKEMLDDLSLKMKSLARERQWDETTVRDWGDRWASMTPSDKYQALQELEVGSDGTESHGDSENSVGLPLLPEEEEIPRGMEH